MLDQNATAYIQNLVQEYYRDLSTNRAVLAGKYYEPQSILTYQDVVINGQEEINKKYCSMAFQNLQIIPSSCDLQPMMGGSFLAVMYGHLRDGSDHPLPFTDVLVLVPINQQLKIMNHVFKLTTM